MGNIRDLHNATEHWLRQGVGASGHSLVVKCLQGNLLKEAEVVIIRQV